MQEASWFIDLFRSLMALLDGIIYGFIDYAYKMMVYLSRLVILDSEQIADITDRIYLILGIIMLFKVAFSLVSYLASPDDFTNGEKGISNIVKRIVISLIMLTFVGNVFNIAYRFQGIILEDNIIPNFVLGSSDNDSDNALATAGQSISFQVFSGFFQLNPITSADNPCTVAENGTIDCQDGDAGLDVDEVEKLELAYNNKDISYLLSMVNVSVSSEGKDHGSWTGWFSDGFYAFNYSVLISTIVGVIVLLIFVSFVFDVVIRLAKLTFLQVIAPIPIISYVDPKGGDKIFKSWVKEVTSTYLSLFIKLTVVFFAIYLCTQVTEFGIGFFDVNTGETVPVTNGGFQHSLAVALVIIGILLFAKEAPKLLESLFGMKGSFTLNPMKRLRQIPVVSKVGTGVAARVTGGITGMRYDQTNNKARAFVNGWSAGKHAMHGKVGLMGGDGKNNKTFRTSMNAAYKETTGSEFKTISPTKMMFSKSARKDQDEIKSKYLTPLRKTRSALDTDRVNSQSTLAALQNSKATAKNKYNSLNAEFQKATKKGHLDEEGTKKYLRNIESQAAELKGYESQIIKESEKYTKISKAIMDIDKDISLYNDQVKDFSKTYDLDESTPEKLEKSKEKLSGLEGKTDAQQTEFLKNKYLK